jgi:ribulose-5-phosphate 4-epimerase/fuculose-1-phosphate aldolase
MYDEGVIKFHADHTAEPLSARRYGELCCKLVAWREIMAMTQLVGRDPARYGGAGYGNVSGRVGPPSSASGKRAMLITGTQTGGVARIGLGQFCVVHEYDYRSNRVRSEGAIEPSSETMTHGAIYDLSPSIRYVFHAHTPTIWRRARELRIPTTDPDVAYGTPEMAREVHRLHRATALSEVRILAMGGHEDGIIVYGHTAEDAGQVLLRYLARAYELVCHGVPSA